MSQRVHTFAAIRDELASAISMAEGECNTFLRQGGFSASQILSVTAQTLTAPVPIGSIRTIPGTNGVQYIHVITVVVDNA